MFKDLSNSGLISVKPVIPTLVPATLQAAVILSFKLNPLERHNIEVATNVSPAPSVSTIFCGGKAGDSTSSLSVWRATAPFSPHATITVAL